MRFPFKVKLAEQTSQCPRSYTPNLRFFTDSIIISPDISEYTAFCDMWKGE